MAKILKSIETDFPVELIEINGTKAWPFVRLIVGNKIINNMATQEVNRFVVLRILSSITYGFFNLFKKFDYLCYSDTLERRVVNGKWYDKSVDYISSLLSNTLVIELPIPNHFKRDKVFSKNISSKMFWVVVEYIYLKVFLNKIKIENKNILTSILTKHKIDFDYEFSIKKVLSQYKISKWYYRFVKPKAIFIECYYTNTGRIKAAKELGIKVVEIQHGVINNEHFAYSVYKDLGNEYYPDYIFTFGEREKLVFNESNYFIKNNNVLPIGNFYLDYVLSLNQDEKLAIRKKAFTYSIAITSQNHPAEIKLIDFLKTSAELAPDILFVFVPRNKRNVIKGVPNIIEAPWLNAYEVIANSDFHSTMFSTCAVEAPSIGVQNIMIDIDNLSTYHWRNILSDETITKYVTTPQQFIDTIRSFQKISKDSIIKSNQVNVASGYITNIKKALSTVLEKDVK